jgi:hypothetical protein
MGTIFGVQVEISCRRFGTTYGSRPRGSSGNFLSTCPDKLLVPLLGFKWKFLADVLGQPIGSHPHASRTWNLRLGPIGCPETSVRKYHYSLRNNPEQHSSQVLRGVNLKSRTYTRTSTVHRTAHKSLHNRHVKQKNLHEYVCMVWRATYFRNI